MHGRPSELVIIEAALASAEREAEAAERRAARARRRLDDIRLFSSSPGTPSLAVAPRSPEFTHLSRGCHDQIIAASPLIPPDLAASRAHTSADALRPATSVEMFRRDAPEAQSALLGIALALHAHVRAGEDSARAPHGQAPGEPEAGAQPLGPSERPFCELLHPLVPPVSQRHPPPAFTRPPPVAVGPAAPAVPSVTAIHELLASFFALVDVDLSLPVAGAPRRAGAPPPAHGGQPTFAARRAPPRADFRSLHLCGARAAAHGLAAAD